LWLLGRQPGSALSPLIALPALTVLIATVARRLHLRCALIAALMVVVGHFGMLVGSMLDFGSLGPLLATCVIHPCTCMAQ
jgi:hypothetical protein